MIFLFLSASIFFLGTIFGSFLNVVSIELEANVFQKKTKKTFWERINRRSKCPECKKELEVVDLFPIFSYLIFLTKCRNCKKKISIRYFLVEVFSGLVFLGFFWKILNNIDIFFILETKIFWEFIFFIPIMCGIILIFLFDLKHKIIPDIIVFPTFFYSLFFILFDFERSIFIFSNFLEDVFRAFSFALPFFALWFISRGKAMGFADWKLIFLLSLLLESATQNLLFVFGAFWIGAIYSLPLLFFKKSFLKTEIPFGPFIVSSFLLVHFFNLSLFQFLNFFSF